ncbi:hypothetical protein bcgnr5372_11860 [Bacillus luti]
MDVEKAAENLKWELEEFYLRQFKFTIDGKFRSVTIEGESPWVRIAD